MFFKGFLLSQRGSSIIIVALAVLVIFACGAIAVDVGYMYSERSEMVTAADAAALAGAYELGNGVSAVADRALLIAQDNGVAKGADISSKSITGIGSVTEVTLQDSEDKIKVRIDTANKEVSVNVTKKAGLFLARVLGNESADIGAKAIARKSPPEGVRGLVPIGIAQSDFNKAKIPNTNTLDESLEFEIKLNSQSQGANAGNFQAVDFPLGSGGSSYEQYLALGYDGLINVGTTFNTKPGVMTGPTKDGIAARIGACTCDDPHICKESCTVCSNVAYGDRDGIICARLAIVPILNIVSYDDVNGTKEVVVQSFAAVFITNVQGNNENAKVYAKFVNDIITPEGKFLTETESNGVTVVKLVE